MSVLTSTRSKSNEAMSKSGLVGPGASAESWEVVDMSTRAIPSIS